MESIKVRLKQFSKRERTLLYILVVLILEFGIYSVFFSPQILGIQTAKLAHQQAASEAKRLAMEQQVPQSRYDVDGFLAAYPGAAFLSSNGTSTLQFALPIQSAMKLSGMGNYVSYDQGDIIKGVDRYNVHLSFNSTKSILPTIVQGDVPVTPPLVQNPVPTVSAPVSTPVADPASIPSSYLASPSGEGQKAVKAALETVVPNSTSQPEAEITWTPVVLSAEDISYEGTTLALISAQDGGFSVEYTANEDVELTFIVEKLKDIAQLKVEIISDLTSAVLETADNDTVAINTPHFFNHTGSLHLYLPSADLGILEFKLWSGQ
ncbi:hypothetical protein O6R05_03200 [Peptoniphilus equinus]|uniref:Uncharacterized protein n=1 Tax=Peptoniphilus equinus TaxID=3016343 RepID=A0ABY7QWC1_9FIRM|nr:hypothetical protein [Peptoniphilus equinus]WBW50565.1 hypothetical protein O6R05_03200 [Peptoniphilus equinus]